MNLKTCSKGWLLGAYIGVLGIVGAQRDRIWANELAFREVVRHTDYVVGAVGSLRNATSGSLPIAGIKGSVHKAYLYWHGPMNTDFPLANASIRLDGTTVTGVHIGTSDDNCWGYANSQAYRADVTAQVRARRNGIYPISGFVKQGTNINANGASLLVFFDDGKTNNNRDVVLFEGNDSNAPNTYDALGWNAGLPGVSYTNGTAYVQMHVSDGQIYPDDSVILNDAVLQGRGSIFQGVTVPADDNGPYGWGNLWDIKTWDITRFLARGTNDFLLTHGYIQHDCISLIVVAFNLPANSVPIVPIGETNTPPTVVGQPEITVRSPAPIVVEADARDGDGDPLDYTIAVDSTIVQDGEIPKGTPQTIGQISLTNAFTVGDHLVVFTVSDGLTNASYTTLVHVIDDTPPVINATNIVVRTDPGTNVAVVNYVVTATDDFPGDISLISLPPPGNAFPIGVTVVTVTAIDANGNRAQKTFTITVIDGFPPTPNCPLDLVQFAEPGTNVALVVYTATVGDNQPGAKLACAPPSGSVFPLGTTAVTCTATDAAGNQALCTFNVTVNPRQPVNRPPTLTGITNLIVHSNAPIVIDATATDLDGNALSYAIRIDGVVVGTGTLPAGTPVTLGTLSVTNGFALGTHTVTFEVNDGLASATFTTTVQVIDVSPPVTNPIDLVVPVDPGTNSAVVTYTITATDNFPGPIQVVVQPPSGTRFPIGTTTVVVVATDASGNSSTNTFTVTVVDNIPPTINCSLDIAVVVDPGTNVARVTYTVTAADNASAAGVPVVCTPESGSLFPIGSTEVRCTATDAAGNRTNCSFRVLVQDRTANRPPTLAGVTEIFVYSYGPTSVTAVATDLDGDALTYTIRIDGVVVQTGALPAGTPVTTATLGVTNTFSLGTHTVTFEVSDGQGTATLTTTVRVIDLIPPVITVPTNMVVGIEPGASNAVVTYTVTATDNFPGPIDVVVMPPSGTVFPLGTNTVVVIATDASGNSSTNSFTVTVGDNIPPTILCSPDLIRYPIGGDLGAIVDFTVTAFDNLPGASVVCVPRSGTLFALGVTTVHCTAIDAARICSFCSFNVTVVPQPDTPTNRPPGVAGQAEIIVNRPVPTVVEARANDDDGNPLSYTITVDGVAAQAGNIPAGAPQTVATLALTNNFALGTHTVVFRVDDGRTNATFTTVVRVVDNTPPTLEAPANIVVPVEAGRTNARVTYTFAAHDEFPGTVSVTSEPPSGTRFPLGTTTVILTATDRAGNRSTATFTVTVTDRTPPSIDCPPDINRATDANVRFAIVTFSVEADDNAPGVIVTCSPASGSAFPVGATVVNCVARDAAGLTNSCRFAVTIRDLPPVMLMPTNIVVVADAGLCSAAVSYSVRLADNATGWTLACSPPPATQFPVGTTPVICTATDGAGNRITNAFTIRVQDRETPLLRLPADLTVLIEASSSSAVVDYATSATDNCPGVQVVCTPPSGSTFPAGSTIVQCAATDESGNVATSSFRVRVQHSPAFAGDSEPPVILGLAASKRCLWPLNRKMVTVTFKTRATDNSGRPLTAEIISICSNEPDYDPIGGKPERDGVITGALTVQLRAECSRPGIDRSYTVVIGVRDAAGNLSSASTTVWVPRDQPRRDFILATTPPEPKSPAKTLAVQPAKKKWNWSGSTRK